MVDFKSKLKKPKNPPLTYNRNPKFQGWLYDDYATAFKDDQSLRFLEPMSAQEPDNYDQGTLDIAELKMDGHRGLLYLLEGGNRAFSRHVSKKTGWYNENSDQIPHIRDLDVPEFYGTILDGEFDLGGDSMDVQSIMGSKPERAIKFQEENGFIPYKVFDILYYRGVNIQAMPLWKRKIFAAAVCYEINEGLGFKYIQFVPIYASADTYNHLYKLWYDYCSEHFHTGILEKLHHSVQTVDSYADLFSTLVSEGVEGLIVKNIDGRYEQKRSKNYIKLKGMTTYDVVVMGYTEPTKSYEGKLVESGRLEDWRYWYHPESDDRIIIPEGESAEEWMEHCDPVTKPFAMGWIGAIRAGVFKVITPDQLPDLYPDIELAQKLGHWYYDKKAEEYRGLVAVVDLKGLPDHMLEDIKENGQKYVEEMRVLEVLSNGMIDREIGSLRHPRFSRWRDDKSPLSCTWEDHVRDYPPLTEEEKKIIMQPIDER